MESIVYVGKNKQDAFKYIDNYEQDILNKWQSSFIRNYYKQICLTLMRITLGPTLQMDGYRASSHKVVQTFFINVTDNIVKINK